MRELWVNLWNPSDDVNMTNTLIITEVIKHVIAYNITSEGG